MAIERTLSIIKPDATRRNLTGKINAYFEEAGLRIIAQKRIHLTQAQAEERAAIGRMNKGGESLEAALEMIELLAPFTPWQSRAEPVAVARRKSKPRAKQKKSGKRPRR